MFWSGNYIVVRELNFLLKEENVTLSQVLEADDILQECKADNKALIQFLTKPEILAELITLITEEPPKSVELTSQYRHANIACEVLTSQLSMLSDRLSLDAAQMNRLCDFINRDPPLNPLLASYFSKTVEMLLERSPKQDWYLYHIVCLRVLDFFKSRRDFLPNLLRHISTSAIADTFKYFIRLDDLFKKTVMEWLEEHQFLECLIQIICGSYVPEQPQPQREPEPANQQHNHKDEPAHGQEVTDAHGDTGGTETVNSNTTEPPQESDGREQREQREQREREQRESSARVAAVASANAAALLCDLIVNGCAGEGCSTRARTSWWLVSRLQSEAAVRALLQGMFTSPASLRRHALVHGTHVLLAMLSRMKNAASEDEAGRGGAWAAERSAVELAVAPHLPLLHQSLLHEPPAHLHAGGRGGGAGPARVQVAALLAQLAQSEVEEVAGTLLTLGTPAVLVDMFFRYESNNFLHAQLHVFVRHALANGVYRTQYARHLLVECDLLTRLMDAYEENKNRIGSPRAGYMGHAIATLASVSQALEAEELAEQLRLPEQLQAKWLRFREDELRPTLHYHDTPLGGCYPSENIYEVENMAETLAANYDFNDMAATATMDELADDAIGDDGTEMCSAGGGLSAESADFIADGLGFDDEDKMAAAKNNFMELASQRFDDDMWEQSPGADGAEAAAGEQAMALRVLDVLAQASPWECGGGGPDAGEGWAQFGTDTFPADTFPADTAATAATATTADTADTADTATHCHTPLHTHRDTQRDSQPADTQADFSPFWAYADARDATSETAGGTELENGMRELRLERGDKRMDEASSAELANNLLTAMSGMSADAIANIVNANVPPPAASDSASEPAAGHR